MGLCTQHQYAFVKICSECVREALLAGGVASKIAGTKFVYSEYWRTWSRVLSPMDALEVGQVELDLTAINSTVTTFWPRIERINIRAHCTRPEAGDLVVDKLPVEVYQLMHKNLDAELIQRLLHEDFLSRIDWYKYRKATNGGAAFASILKGSN